MKRVDIHKILSDPQQRQRLMEGMKRFLIAIGRDNTRPVKEPKQ